MAEIRFAGVPTGLTLSTKILNPDTLTVLETVSLSESGTYYTGTTSETGLRIFEILISGSKVGSLVRTISGDPCIVDAGLEGSEKLEEIKLKTDQIGAVTFLISGNAVTSNGDMVIKAGDRHEFTLTSDTEDVVPDLTGETIRFGIRGNGVQLLETTAVTVVEGTGFQSVSVVLTPAETIQLASGAYHFDVQAEYSATDHRTLISGSVQVNNDYSGTP